MPLSQQLFEYVSACCTALWVQSHEHQDALSEIAQLCAREDWRLAVWDLDQGLRIDGQSETEDQQSRMADPLAAIRAINALAAPAGTALLVLTNFHRFTNSAEVVQALAHQITAGKQNRTFVMILSPLLQIPTELEKQFVVIEHELPGRDQLEALARGIATEDGELPEGDALARVLDAAAGLTRYEVEAADHVVPVAATAAESVQRLRDWASGRCLNADASGIFRAGGTVARKRRRSIARDPSLN